MTTHTPRPAAAKPPPPDIVLEVPPEEQDAYTRHSYHDLMHAWNTLVDQLADARQSGESALAARLTQELQHFWPRANAVAAVTWVPDDEREAALPPVPQS